MLSKRTRRKKHEGGRNRSHWGVIRGKRVIERVSPIQDRRGGGGGSSKVSLKKGIFRYKEKRKHSLKKRGEIGHKRKENSIRGREADSRKG